MKAVPTEKRAKLLARLEALQPTSESINNAVAQGAHLYSMIHLARQRGQEFKQSIAEITNIIDPEDPTFGFLKDIAEELE